MSAFPKYQNFYLNDFRYREAEIKEYFTLYYRIIVLLTEFLLIELKTINKKIVKNIFRYRL
jgi:hypothetical protein